MSTAHRRRLPPDTRCPSPADTEGRWRCVDDGIGRDSPDAALNRGLDCCGIVPQHGIGLHPPSLGIAGVAGRSETRKQRTDRQTDDDDGQYDLDQGLADVLSRSASSLRLIGVVGNCRTGDASCPPCGSCARKADERFNSGASEDWRGGRCTGCRHGQEPARARCLYADRVRRRSGDGGCVGRLMVEGRVNEPLAATRRGWSDRCCWRRSTQPSRRFAASFDAPQAEVEPLLTRLLIPTTATADRMPINTMAIRISMSVNPSSSCTTPGSWWWHCDGFRLFPSLVRAAVDGRSVSNQEHTNVGARCQLRASSSSVQSPEVMVVAATTAPDGGVIAAFGVCTSWVNVVGYALALAARYTVAPDRAASRDALQADDEPLLTRLLIPTTATADRIPMSTMAMRISISVKPRRFRAGWSRLRRVVAHFSPLAV